MLRNFKTKKVASPCFSLTQMQPWGSRSRRWFPLNSGPQNHRSHGAYLGEKCSFGGFSSEPEPSPSSICATDALQASLFGNSLGSEATARQLFSRWNKKSDLDVKTVLPRDMHRRLPVMGPRGARASWATCVQQGLWCVVYSSNYWASS